MTLMAPILVNVAVANEIQDSIPQHTGGMMEELNFLTKRVAQSIEEIHCGVTIVGDPIKGTI